ncbi:MAG: hypothetical protein LBI49_03535 [Nocardiopsaceae bacterium]|jgi:hypothetical protein|nr:hypothetical protein [Nocardiopsaceae bacterium]
MAALSGVVTEGGRRGWIAVLAGGFITGGATLIVPALLSRSDALGFLAILLGAIGAVYLGFVLADGRAREFRIESAGILLFGVLATIGLTLAAPAVLAAGYLGHGLWDSLHGRRGIHTRIPWWYAPWCIGFDVVVGVYLLVAF